MVTPCFSARGRSVSVASSAMRDRSTCSGVKDRWSARLSRSNASVRSIARVLTAWRRSTSSLVVAVRIVAGDVEKCLRDRQRGAQFVGGVGCESLLFGDVCLEPREEAVEGVGEILELVAGPREREALVQVALGDLPRRRRDRAQRAQDPARDQPAERDRDRGHDRQRDPGLDEPLVETVGVTCDGPGVHLAHMRTTFGAVEGPGRSTDAQSRSGRSGRPRCCCGRVGR